jgi:hypothetical protein
MTTDPLPKAANQHPFPDLGPSQRFLVDHPRADEERTRSARLPGLGSNGSLDLVIGGTDTFGGDLLSIKSSRP